MIQFKKENGERYCNQLATDFTKRLDPLVQTAIKDLNEFTENTFGKSVTITCVNRSVIDNKKVGGSSTSAHLDRPEGRRAVDLRSRGLSESEIKRIVEYLKHRWGGLLYVLVHNAGTGPHIHINLRWDHARHSFH